MSAAQAVLVIFVILSLVLVIAGVIVAALAGLRLKRKAAALKRSPLFGYSAEAQAQVARISACVEAAQPLLDRFRIATTSINRSVAELRIPQAVLAVRIAVRSVRLLISGC